MYAVLITSVTLREEMQPNKFNGTGLGLYLSMKLARFLRGRITAESEMHKGSLFTFTFPIAYEKQEDI